MMSSENASNKIVQSLIDLVNMAKWLIDESQQLSVRQELGRLHPSIRGRGRGGESSELLLRVGAGGKSSASATDINNTSFATRSTRKRRIEEIWGSKASSKKPLKSLSHKKTSGKTPSKFAILSRIKPSNFRFVTWLGSSRQEVFSEKGVLRNFTKFTGKHLCRSLFLNKVAGLRPAFLLSEFCEISKNTFPYRTLLVAAFVDSCHFSSLISHDCSLKFSKQKVSYFVPFQSCPKEI